MDINERDTIARAVYRYQQGPGTFEKPGTLMGELVKNLSVVEAENIRRAFDHGPIGVLIFDDCVREQQHQLIQRHGFG